MNILGKEHCNFSKLEVKTGHLRDWHDSETYNFDSCLPIYYIKFFRVHYRHVQKLD
jgi:hypothetical protein